MKLKKKVKELERRVKWLEIKVRDLSIVKVDVPYDLSKWDSTSTDFTGIFANCSLSLSNYTPLSKLLKE